MNEFDKNLKELLIIRENFEQNYLFIEECEKIILELDMERKLHAEQLRQINQVNFFFLIK